MFKELAKNLKYPEWADERYRCLYALDRMLDGTIFDDLEHSFYDGSDASLLARRPSVHFNIPRYVARQCARKLFAGRHAPRFVHQDEKLAAAATALMAEGFLNTRILQAVVWGSVGAVAVTFKVLPGGEGIARIVFNVWRARHCWPTFDELGELARLRIYYPTKGPQLVAMGIAQDEDGKELEADEKYWFVRDYLPGEEITYAPRREDAENAEDIWLRDDLKVARGKDDKELRYESEEETVQAHWFVNLSGGDFPDGACTWDAAKNETIELAYTLSQTGRGVRYNQEPEVVTKGRMLSTNIMSPGNDVHRGANKVMQFEGGRTEPDGTKYEAGDAKLLEMNGQSVRAALLYAEAVRKYALEQIAASRKDPERMRMPQSGKAMELLDEDFFDLVGELRTSYGENGLLPLMRKAIRVASAKGHPLLEGVKIDTVDALGLEWPKPYLPNAQELLQFVQALALLLGKPEAPGVDGAPGIPAQPGIITNQEARKMFEMYFDMPAAVTVVAQAQQPIKTEKPGEGATPAPLDTPAAGDPDDDGNLIEQGAFGTEMA